jgi:hypothetical protein
MRIPITKHILAHLHSGRTGRWLERFAPERDGSGACSGADYQAWTAMRRQGSAKKCLIVVHHRAIWVLSSTAVGRDLAAWRNFLDSFQPIG